MVNVFDWFQLASEKENRMIQMRRYMHQYPEPSFEETWTHNYILNQLSHLDCEIVSPVGRNGIKATFKGKMVQLLHFVQTSMHYQSKN